MEPGVGAGTPESAPPRCGRRPALHARSRRAVGHAIPQVPAVHVDDVGPTGSLDRLVDVSPMRRPAPALGRCAAKCWPLLCTQSRCHSRQEATGSVGFNPRLSAIRVSADRQPLVVEMWLAGLRAELAGQRREALEIRRGPGRAGGQPADDKRSAPSPLPVAGHGPQRPAPS